MRRIIIVLAWIIFKASALSGQSIDEALMKLEYRIYQATDDTLRNDLMLEKVLLMLSDGRTDETVWKSIERIDREKLKDDSSLMRFSYSRVLLAHLNGHAQSAWAEMNRYARYKKTLTDGESLLRIQLAYAYGVPEANDYLSAFIAAHPESMCISCLEDIYEMELKERKALVVASYFIPGIGLVFNGNVFRGATSMALNGAAGYGAYWLIAHKMPFTGVFWGLAILPKSYFGNIRLLKSQIESKQLSKREKLATTCELFWIEVYKKYPLPLIQ